LEDIAGWIAPAATMIAAIMTAANLGSRITGWGFVIFTIGAAGWCVEALLTHQPNLLWSNAFLGVIDLIGIYRWLGQRAKLEDGARAATEKSRTNSIPLFPVLSLDGRAIEGSDGEVLAHVVGAMGECDSGRIAYLVVRGAGADDGETRLRVMPWNKIEVGDAFRTPLSPDEIAKLQGVDADNWPGSVSNQVPESAS
jgi:hypothetical protein